MRVSQRKTGKVSFLILITCIVLSGCGTILGGKISDCQRYRPAPGYPKRQIRPAALMGDLVGGGALFFLLPDFLSGGIYQPCQDTSWKLNKPDTNWHIKNKLFISGGLGESTIFLRIYGINITPPDNPAYGVSQSLVYNGAVDYGVNKTTTIGACISYQTATGVPFSGSIYDGATENFTRLNISARILFYWFSNTHFEMYSGFRIGASYWTDFVNVPPGGATAQLTLGSNYSSYPSFQYLTGVRFFTNNFGLHLEVGIGTPYIAEAGITCRL